MIIWLDLDPFAGFFGCVIWYFNMYSLYQNIRLRLEILFFLTYCDLHEQYISSTFGQILKEPKTKNNFIWKPQYSASWSWKDRGVVR